MRIRVDIDRLILDIHAAPLEPDRWHGVLESLCEIHRAENGQLLSIPATRNAPFWSISRGVSDEAKADYAAEFGPEDVWVIARRARNENAAGTISAGEELIDRREFLRTRFYNEFLAPHGHDRFLNAVLRSPVAPGMPSAAMLSLYRGPGEEAFGRSERETLKRLTPHLIVAIDTFWKTQALMLERVALSQTLDAVAAPLFVIDHVGHAIFANHAAETELRIGECLRIVDGCLAPSAAVLNPKACLDALRTLRAGRAGTARLTIGPTARTVMLSTAPLAEAAARLAPSGLAAGLVWLAPTQRTPHHLRRIAGVFALTSAEERLLATLAAGSSLTEAAETLNISIHTARTQLKAIQQKTGWHTQSELARMVQQFGVIDPRPPRMRPPLGPPGHAKR